MRSRRHGAERQSSCSPSSRLPARTSRRFLLYDSELLGEGSPAALNDVGQVVGESHDVQGELRATLWETAGARFLLPGPQQSRAYDINDAGEVLVARRVGVFY